jgi:type IV secretion system protein TrbJ
MKLTPKLRRNLIIGAVAFASIATPSYAIFGIGDIVFDPTNYAQLVSQLTTLQSQYTMLHNNLTHFSWKNTWQTTKNQLEHVPFSSVFGETAGFDVALTTNNPTAAQSAWRNSTLQTNSNATSYVGSQPSGSVARSQLAAIEATDATSAQCVAAVGAYRAAVTVNATAEASLQSSQLDNDDDTNSQTQQLNLVNAAQAQQLVEMKQQGMLHACLAQQMAVASMQQRNAQANDLNTWGFVQQQHQTNNVNPAGSSNTWTTYLP